MAVLDGTVEFTAPLFVMRCSKKKKLEGEEGSSKL
jgi:hypothetical protein